MVRPRITTKAKATSNKGEVRRPRGPTLRSLVKLAVRCEDAEELGRQLKRRYDRSLVRRGNLKPQQSDLTPVLRRPVEPAAQKQK